MNYERWQQIERLYHLARERGPSVLAATDPELRRDVERLLAQDSEDKILDRSWGELMNDISVGKLPADVPLALAGQTIAHYEILELLGVGGMGVVYKAIDTRLNRLVALKFLPSHMRQDAELKRDLTEEARAASKLDHPNIVVVHDIQQTRELFIVMAFHEGKTLREKIASGLGVRESLQIALQIASGLAKAHEHGISHRDIKPSNIIVAKDGVARIIDFGLAHSSHPTASSAGFTRGTPLYMSPEQVAGQQIDFRTDLWSLGAVLYEMLAGAPPFRGATRVEVLRGVMHKEPPPLREVRTNAIVSRALQKNSDKRYQSATEMISDLSAALHALDAPPRRISLRAVYAMVAALILLVTGASAWFYRSSEKRHWAHEQAIPEIAKLRTQNKALAAFRVLREAQGYSPGDPQLTEIADGLSHSVSVNSSPPGASVEIKDYLSPGEPWLSLGITPINDVKIPNGYLRWRVAKPGAGEFVGAPVVEDIHGFVRKFHFPLDSLAAPEGMVAVPAGQAFSIVWSLGDVGPYELPAFYMDRFEVTNRQYQKFVDKGGYGERKYWKEKFIRDGREWNWEQALNLLRDSTGQAGPATWRNGRYPAGRADDPVSGVSWYEASAYAEFAGKSLPVVAQWYLAAPSAVAKYITAQSNFSASLAPVGAYKGVGPFGTYDMAGNVAEWCRNESGGGAHYLLGGGTNTATAEYFEPAGIPPFHRAANSGFRCVRNTEALPVEATSERRQTLRDFGNAKPVAAPIFRAYRAMYSYDRTPLHAAVQEVASESREWRKEKVSFDAAYNKERMTAYLFLPSHGKVPLQTVVFLPSARVLDLSSSVTLGDLKFIDYVIQSGRAVMYPIIKGTYERTAPPPGPDTVAARETLIQDSKDIGRSIDYLETREDIDRNHLGYLGVSMNAANGVIFTGVENRFKAIVLLDVGFFSENPLPGTDQVDFAPRITAPALLVSGKFDWIFMGKDALLRILGSPATDKRAVTFDTAHDVSEQRADMVREVLAWFDKYLGKLR